MATSASSPSPVTSAGRHAAELRYRELMETIDKGIIVRKRHGDIVHVNPAAMRILELDDASLEQDLHRDNWRTFDEHGREVSENEQPATYALRTGRIVESTVLGFYNKRVRPAEMAVGDLRTQFAVGARKAEQVLSLFSDVTALKRDSTLFDRAQSLAHIGGWEWDTGRDSLYLTEEARRILGTAARAEHHGRPARLPARTRPPPPAHRTRPRDSARARTQPGPAGLAGEWPSLLGTRNRRRRNRQPAQRAHHRYLARTSPNASRPRKPCACRRAPIPSPACSTATPCSKSWKHACPIRTMSRAAVLYIDLDRFKIVNDVLGHAAGDRLLSAASRRIQRAIGSEGLIARFGGDEFLVICSTGDEPTRPERLADAILEAFSRASAWTARSSASPRASASRSRPSTAVARNS
jgi:hypothetical protein